MKAIRFLALLAMAAMFSVSFNSCNLIDDDDPVNKYDDFDECTWNDLSKEAKFMSAYPELEGTFTDGSVLLNTAYGNVSDADYVTFQYEMQEAVINSYLQKLADNKFLVSRLGNDYFLAYKVADGYQYSFQYSGGMVVLLAQKFNNDEEYQEALKDYQENLENQGPVNVVWDDVLKEADWLKNFPAASGTFSKYVVGYNSMVLQGGFSAEYLEKYAQQLEAAGFVEMPNSSRTSFKKDLDNGGYYYVVMNEVMINFYDYSDN